MARLTAEARGTESGGRENQLETLQSAGKHVDSFMLQDRKSIDLCDSLKVYHHGRPSVSGMSEMDYPSVNLQLSQMSPVKKVPLPPELVEQFGHMQCNCLMGVFTEISRAWLTIDSDLFVWNYEDGDDLAYFDGLNETILSVGLVKPKPGIFKPHIAYLLCLTTPVDIVLLGVSFTLPQSGSSSVFGEMHLLPEPLYSIATDNVHMLTIFGTKNGRIFTAGKDGCLYEIVYQAEDGWFSRKCYKINHSTSKLSFLVPSFIAFSFMEDDPLNQIAVDESRNILYTKSEKGTLQVYDIGADGFGMCHVTSLSLNSIVQNAARVAGTIDKSNFRPIAHIAAIPMSESSKMHLVAVTSSGVRLYFVTSPIGQNSRPGMLTLVHVRLPPGFTASASLLRPNKVHAAYYRKGTTLLSSSQSEDMDVLWCLCPDSFPFQQYLMETKSTVALDGRTWAVGEVPEQTVRASGQRAVLVPDPPSVVTQHMMPLRRLVLVSSQGSHIFNLLTPAEQLRQLMLENSGPDNVQVESFFRLHKEEQACATCLVLACSKSAGDTQVADWATQAFFRYGGENRARSQLMLAHSPLPAASPIAGNTAAAATSLTPRIGNIDTPGATGLHPTSTPQMQATGSINTVATEQHQMNREVAPTADPAAAFSGCFRGLCIYFARTLSLVWDSTMVVETVQPFQKNMLLLSRFDSEDIAFFLNHLETLREFMEKNSQYAGVAGSLVTPILRTSEVLRGGQVSREVEQQQQAQLQTMEKVALVNLQLLVDISCEVLALWKVLCDHQFHIITGSLNSGMQSHLKFMKFKDLVYSIQGREVCSALITSLVNCYLGDNASIDAISQRLREISPTLYSRNDAVCSKAQEKLQSAKTARSQYEKDCLLKDSLQLFSEIAQQINLAAICAEYQSVKFYEGILELCLTAASKRDRQKLALYFYKNGEPPEDTQGVQAFLARLECYRYVTQILGYLLERSQRHEHAPSIPKQPGPPLPPSLAENVDPSQDISPQQFKITIDEILKLALQSTDELFHVALYDWLSTIGLSDRLLEISSPFLESYLKRAASENLAMLDLLWKYYEKHKNYSAAARILSKLAERHSTEVNLQQRIEYLSRAIMCAKSSNMRAISATDGEFLHDLEEKMEVARIQLLIHDKLLKFNSHLEQVTEAISKLNSELIDISRLYGDFADPFKLSECKLAIIHSAGHYDPTLVETLWQEIIDAELDDTFSSTAQTRITALSNKIISLGKIYFTSQRYFPIEFLVEYLEKKTCKLSWEKSWVLKMMLRVGVSLTQLHNIYDRLFKAKDPYWQSVAKKPLHVLESILLLLLHFAENPTKLNAQERRHFTTVCLDSIASYCVELESMGMDSTVQMTLARLKELQAKLERLT